jgi:hypothetical protein
MLYYKTMDTKTIVMCVVALLIGMLMANMLKSVCGCKTVEGGGHGTRLPAHHRFSRGMTPSGLDGFVDESNGGAERMPSGGAERMPSSG